MCRQKEMYKNIKILSANPSCTEKIETWRCPNCVYVYHEQWFEKFNQYESFLLRDTGDKEMFEKRFEKVLKKDDEGLKMGI